MITYFPTPYPDELVYSCFCRYYVHSGCLSHKMALQELYCKRSDNPSKEFIGNLKPQAMERIGKILPLDELVLKHTMYPQYARFVPLEQKKSALYRLIYDSCDVHHLFSVLPRIDREQYLRFCPICVREDRKTYGETYWHRKHQIRNMYICTKHKCRLIESSVIAKSEQSYTFFPAESQTCENNVIMDDNEMLIHYSAYLESVFDAPINLETDIPISAILYDGMSQTKYMMSSGKCRYTKLLADDMNEFFGSMDIGSAASMYQIQRVLLGNRFDFSVVCQIAFFLGMKPEELTSSSLSFEKIQREQASHCRKDIAPIDWARMDAETAPVLEQIVRGIYDGTANENGRPERVSERLVYREVDLSAHRLENMPICRQIFERYTESYPESWARKIIWAYQKLKENGDPFYWSDIRELSGVKKKNIPAVIPYLIKHTDTDTAEQIVTLIGVLQ